MVDLRSDTVTRPTPRMRKAMAEAEVGDDVLGDDPTVKRLEAVGAERLGKEAAIFVPSGTMANQIAIRLHTRPGDEVLMYEGAHPFNYEAGGAAAIAGVQIRPLPALAGILDCETVASAIRAEDDHFAPATLLCLEDTTNRGGGAVYPVERIEALTALARERGLKTHLDGARAFNAAVASRQPIATRVEGFDTVSVCLSKGLGAPVGSLLVGTSAAMRRARRIRKMLGGGMRQSGILAAAGLYALEHNVDRLADDHDRARVLAAGLADLGLEVQPVHTNMVYVRLADASRVQTALEAQGVRCFAVGPDRMRLVVHLDVDDDGIDQAIRGFIAAGARSS